ncbi:MAG: hypothetical protein Q9164_003255, partial [Protoblastenia rupestris]
MGFHVTITEGHVTINEGQKLLESPQFPNWRSLMEESLGDGDYVEPKANRFLPFGNELLPEKVKSIQDYDQNQHSNGQAGLQEAGRKRGEGLVQNRDGHKDPSEGTFEPRAQDREIGVDDYNLGLSFHSYRKSTLIQLHEEFSAAQVRWNNSHECKALIAQLEHRKGASNLTVTNIVALGIGSLHDTAPKEALDKSSLQLAALLTLRNCLG